jgi:hypothetical protein
MNLFPEDFPDGFKEWFTSKFYDPNIFEENKRKKKIQEKRRIMLCHKTDFVREGQALSHCVGMSSSYFNDHIKGERMIFFVRKLSNIDKPFATLQIDMKRFTIIQFHGCGNKPQNGDSRKFVNGFLKQLSKKYKAKTAERKSVKHENSTKQNRKETQTA